MAGAAFDRAAADSTGGGQRYEALFSQGAKVIDELKDQVQKGNPAVVDTLQAALAAHTAAFNTLLSAYKLQTEGKAVAAMKYKSLAIACRDYSQALSSMPGVLPDDFADDVKTIATEKRNTIVRATADQKSNIQKMEEAQAQDLPMQTHIKYMEGVTALQTAFSERSKEIEEEKTAQNEAFDVLARGNAADEQAEADEADEAGRSPVRKAKRVYVRQQQPDETL